MESFNPIILSLVTFLPAAGGLLILLIPRRDRDIKWFALVVTIATFVASLHLPVHLHRDPGTFKFEIDKIWISSPNIHYHMADIEPQATVTVLTVERGRAASELGTVPGGDIAAHLARHGFKVTAARSATEWDDLGRGRAASYASDIGTDLLVVGGYGHSRAREMVLGGVSRGLLQHMTVPLLMSH